ncbi:hypothetical protein QZH41_006001 [Actinostola sp. cb2023]|nr:hypothetical protein QZH41_006001 [Actinostola sp. cb2023]
MADGNEDLNASFHEMSLEDGGSTCRTPAKKSLSFEKHGLTPDSKKQGIPKSKARKIDQGNQKYPNDIQLLFGLLCMSYGGGKQCINMLNSIGLSLHWDSLTKHLDERLDKFQNIINKECPRSSPVILLMDNINMYKGNKRHYRLFKKLSPKMWNFTGRGAIVPNLDGIEHLLQCESTAVHSQIDFSELTVDDISLDSMADHNQLWSNFLDAYYIKLLKLSLNHIPPASKQFKEMTEAEINIWLSSINFEEFEKLSKPYIIRGIICVLSQKYS